jgi:hypothetical protein
MIELEGINMHVWARNAIKEGVVQRLEKAIATTSDPVMRAIHEQQLELIKRLASAS